MSYMKIYFQTACNKFAYVVISLTEIAKYFRYLVIEKRVKKFRSWPDNYIQIFIVKV